MVRDSFNLISHPEEDGRIPAQLQNQVPCCLGIDEAGRGPVLGPMCYGVAVCPLDRHSDLKTLGMADSKKLTEERRTELLDVINTDCRDWAFWSVRVLTPRDISRSMLRQIKYNLNSLSHDTAIDLIRLALARQLNIKEVYVDTVGSPEKYQAMLSSLFPGIKITVSKGADDLFPIVSAASICAKVHRDRLLSKWKFAEPGLQDHCSMQFGSGYPGDPATKRWLKENVDYVFGYPELIRFSWATCRNLLESEAASVFWPFDDEDGEEEADTDVRKAKGSKRACQSTLTTWLPAVEPAKSQPRNLMGLSYATRW